MPAATSTPRDYSLFSLFTAGLACLVPLTTAYTQADGELKGNDIYTPGLKSVVPVGKPYEITWNPTTSGTVDLVLLKGPSSNAVPQYAIAEQIENSGSYMWTPSEDLEPGQTGYGIQLIVDSNGDYQYSTQFGISNSDYKAGTNQKAVEMTSAVEPASTSAAAATTSKAETTSIAPPSSTEAEISTTSSAVEDATTTTSSKPEAAAPTTSVESTVQPTEASATISEADTTTVAVPTTAGMPANGSIIQPSGSMAVPSSLRTTASAGFPGANATSSSTVPTFTGAASTMATSLAGLVVAAGVAVFAV